MSIPIPIAVLYAGLAGTLLALLVATATNRWHPKVFLLLALRLTIGWHFLFEGLHKIHSHSMGVTETSRPFTSEPYFSAAEGPFGGYMRSKYLGDSQSEITTRLTPKKEITSNEFAKLAKEEQAQLCPDAVATDLSKAISESSKADEAKVQYARWIYGVDKREAKAPFVSGSDVAQSVPDRMQHIAVMKKFVNELESRDAIGLGSGYGMEVKRASAARADLRAAEANLVLDGEKFVTDLITKHKGTTPAEKPKALEKMDRLTMWTITIVGICLLAGVLTPLSCVIGAGFLALTYLTHPPFPWYPLPPNTEGNPLFVNKNVIEMIALLVIAVHPTGRWLGVDALFCRLLCRSKKSHTANPTPTDSNATRGE